MNKIITFYFLLILVVLLMPLSASAESKPITKEEVFTTTNSNFYYDFDKKIKVNDKNYKLVNVSYTELERKPKEEVKTIEKVITYKNLKKRSCNAKKTITFEQNGQKITASLTSVSYDKSTVTGKFKEVTEKKQLGASDDKPGNIPENIKYSGEGTDDNMLTLSDVQPVGTSWEDSEEIPITCKKYNNNYYELGNDILIDGSTHNLNGYEKEIANIVNIDTAKCRITSIRLVGNDYKKGKSTYRKGIITCQKKVTTWQAIYKGKILLPNRVRYTANARYVATVTDKSTTEFIYKVKATATYNLVKAKATAKTNFMPVVYGSIAILSVVFLIVFVTILIKKRKRKALGY